VLSIAKKSMTLNDLERKFTAVWSELSEVLTNRPRLESRGFRYTVALYLSYLHVKFDDEIKGNPLEFQA